ncbi:uncharacterized protein BT62DRAFT_614784 [Guyanagaster necrorhizus]|uniref:Uncharacterized protein n=1 Tax=Guyanagaster necrorhizus TaxID=856835 RepID=A0A9P8AVV0_9AGAR|nr:uncharacterized protein BT62DRAFT_614784 [Guyanagaster necrorhizus MCA 3950]KAG7449913.1 hypothetical protein BT62DRAFT_614784 [Guyanagaster necrorhizus MCA 3950]
MSTKIDPSNSNMMLSPKIASIPVKVDYSLLAMDLCQVTRHFVLVGVEDKTDRDLPTVEKLDRPRACDIRFATLPNSGQQRHGGWSFLEFPLEPREKIRTFRLDETNGLLAVITWFDEPVSKEGTLRMRLRIVRFPKLVLMPGAATQEFPFEIAARNDEASPVAWIDIHNNLIGIRVHELEESTLRVYDWKTGVCRLEDRCPRGSQGTTFVFLREDTIAVACRNSAAVNILTLPPSSSATTTRPYPKLTAAIRTLKISTDLLPPISQNSVYTAYPQRLPPPPEGEPDIIFPSVNCFSSIDSNIVVVSVVAFGRSTDIAIHRETLRSFSASAPPMFPNVSVGQYIGDMGGVGRVIIPWEEWGEGKVEVFTGFSGESMVDGSWYATLSKDRRLRIHDFGSWWGAGPQPTGSGGKIILDGSVGYNEAIVQFRENRVLGMVTNSYDDDDCFSSIDVFQVRDLKEKENRYGISQTSYSLLMLLSRSNPTNRDNITSRESKIATTS